MMHGYQKEQHLQIHVITKMLDELCSTDDASARATADYAIRHTSTELFCNRFGSISGFNFSVVYSNMGPNNDWLRKRFRDHISGSYHILAEVGFNPDEEGEDVIHIPQLEKGAVPYSFLFIVESDDGEVLEEELRDMWVRGDDSLQSP